MKEADTRNISCSGVVRVPLRTAPAWPPAWLAASSTASTSSDAQWDALSRQRLGPSLESSDPLIDIERDWRHEVAGWPHEQWVRWRRTADEALANRPLPHTVEEIQTADRYAYLVIADKPAPLAPATVKTDGNGGESPVVSSDGRVDTQPEPTTKPWPPRDPRLASWPIPKRQRWGELANAYEDAGTHWAEAERRAFEEVLNEGLTEGLEPTSRSAYEQPSLAYEPAVGSEANPRRTHP